eukprot:7592953-Pyramimonas_sp.AAC.1
MSNSLCLLNRDGQETPTRKDVGGAARVPRSRHPCAQPGRERASVPLPGGSVLGCPKATPATSRRSWGPGRKGAG